MEKKIIISDSEKRALIEYFSGSVHGNTMSILNNWLETDDQNKLLFDQLSDIWQAGSYAGVNNKIDVEHAWSELQKQLHVENNQLRIWSTVWLRIAAVFVFAFFLGGSAIYLFNKVSGNKLASSVIEYVAPLGSRSFIQLADGSKVWLNSGSTIKYKNTFGAKNREISLNGEAFFEVAKNKHLPFVVKTSEINVVALGTKFNVKAYQEEKTIETTLIEGSVRLESDCVKLTGNVVLSPNQKATYTKKHISTESEAKQPEKTETADSETKPKLAIEKEVKPEPIISWKEKRWIINNEKLGDLAVKLERRYDVNFIFDNELLKDYSFGGTLEDETLEQIMDAISFSSPIKYIIDNKIVYVMADGQKMERFKNLLAK